MSNLWQWQHVSCFQEHKEKKIQRKVGFRGSWGGAGGEGGPDTSRTIIDMPNITIFYGRPSWILVWE